MSVAGPSSPDQRSTELAYGLIGATALSIALTVPAMARDAQHVKDSTRAPAVNLHASVDGNLPVENAPHATIHATFPNPDRKRRGIHAGCALLNARDDMLKHRSSARDCSYAFIKPWIVRMPSAKEGSALAIFISGIHYS
jgi:hypothetical protein